MIPYGRQNISKDDIDSVVTVLKSDWLTQGAMVPSFEAGLCKLTGAKNAIVVSNATAALHLACLALGLGQNDTLWTSPNTFVASANCARYCGADVDFVDIDIETGNMSVLALQSKLEQADKKGALPKILVSVHFAGQSCDMQQIKKLSEKYGFKIIEDAAHAVGGTYKKQAIGSCQFSDITIFSFHPVKIITTGEGGALLCNDQKIADKLERLRSHGITKDTLLMQGQSEGEWCYEQIELGYNYRMTDIQAALGQSQLSRIQEFVRKRSSLASRYSEILQGLKVIPLEQISNSISAWHLYVVRLQETTIEKSEIFSRLRQQGVGVQVHYIPVHLQPYYKNLGFKLGDYPQAEKYYRQAISLPLYPDLSFEQQDYVVKTLDKVLS